MNKVSEFYYLLRQHFFNLFERKDVSIHFEFFHNYNIGVISSNLAGFLYIILEIIDLLKKKKTSSDISLIINIDLQYKFNICRKDNNKSHFSKIPCNLHHKKILQAFRDLKIRPFMLEKKLNQSPYQLEIAHQIVVGRENVIRVFESFFRKQITLCELVRWVNIVSFAELFTFRDEEADILADIFEELEQLDEDGYYLDAKTVQAYIVSLKQNRTISPLPVESNESNVTVLPPLLVSCLMDLKHFYYVSYGLHHPYLHFDYDPKKGTIFLSGNEAGLWYFLTHIVGVVFSKSYSYHKHFYGGELEVNSKEFIIGRLGVTTSCIYSLHNVDTKK